MFNRSSFDRSAYNRNNNLENDISATIRSAGGVNANLVLKTTLNDFSIGGTGSLIGTLIMKQTISANLSGDSSLNVDAVKLIQRLSSNIQSYGDLTPNMSIKTPLGDIHMSGFGEFIDKDTYVKQHITDSVDGAGDLSSSLVLIMPIDANLNGTSTMNVDDQFKMEMPIGSDMSGAGTISSARIGETNSDTIEFTGLGLKSGQTLIIDTDELDVYINNILNVSSVTSDSVFFQLKPGENELTIKSADNPNLAVTIIWQNRWL